MKTVLLAVEVGEGFFSSERSIYFKTAENKGCALLVDESYVEAESLRVVLRFQESDRSYIELPSDPADGSRLVWVSSRLLSSY